jgi:hypothetical protein
MEHWRMPSHHALVVLVAGLVAVNSAGCRDDANSAWTQRMVDKTIQQVQEEHTDEWMTLPGVVGTALGQCEGKPCILVFTAADPEQVRRKIPPMVEGYPVVVQYTGEIRARSSAP